ncbi:MAG TPA: hypothetical protein DDW76_06370, partial [Cyanobacteria bacterium UBA11369]|nr:hypothetical protein [Cyanobacteria bacterium UBA11371]HBE48430.1 hypothetical protein [Cyanobacteria bacterium UBA11369]
PPVAENKPIVETHPVSKTKPIQDSLGIFTVGNDGKVSIDFLFDGGAYQGEVAIVSLAGMEDLEPGSEAFIQEAAKRANSNSELGYVVIRDRIEGAKFNGILGEPSQNSGEYQGSKTFTMRPGDKFAIMLVPNGTVQQVAENPGIGGDVRPLFSLSTQIADVTGDGHTFAFEDLPLDGFSDRDYNDLIFQIKGATGKAIDLDDVINPTNDWRDAELGQEILKYTDASMGNAAFDSTIEEINTELVPEVDNVLKELNAQLQQIIAKPDSALVDTTPDVEQQADREIRDLEAELDSAIAELTDDPLSDIGVLAGKYEFPKANQPLVGIIDTGFVDKNPDIDYNRIILGRDRIGNDNNPLLAANENEDEADHGTKILEIIAATQNNNIGIDGVNDDAPLWLGRAVGSGKWHESLIEFVDAAKASKQPNAIINLSFDLTETKPDGTVVTRTQFTPAEKAAIEYASQNNVLIVAAAGNQGEANISALGKASREFDNIITVGAFDGTGRADYSNYGTGLDILAYGNIPERSQTATNAGEVDLSKLLTPAQLEAFNKALAVDQTQPYDTTANIENLSTQDEKTAFEAAQKAIKSALGELNNIGSIDSSSIQGQDEIAGTSIAAAKVAGAASQVWAANPKLSFKQVIDILKKTALDLGTPGWDAETGVGLLSLAIAMQMAVDTKPESYTPGQNADIDLDLIDEGLTTLGERPAGFWKKVKNFFRKVTNVVKKVVNVVKKVVAVVKKVIDIGKKVWSFFSKARGIFAKIKGFFTKVVGKFIALPIFGKIGVIFGGLALVAGAIGGLVWWLRRRRQQPEKQPPDSTPQPDPTPQQIRDLQAIWNNLNATQRNDLRFYLQNGIPPQYRNLLDGSPASQRTLSALSTWGSLTTSPPPELLSLILLGTPPAFLSFFEGTSPPDPGIPQSVVNYWNSLTPEQKQGFLPALRAGIPIDYRPLFQNDPDRILPILGILGNLSSEQRNLLWSFLATPGGVPDQYHSFFP